MKKINVAELLKDCPKGMELYSPLCGKCVFDRLNMGTTIVCKKQNTQEITFTREGYYMLPVFDDCECMIFPSKDQRDWSKFQRPFKDGDICYIKIGNRKIGYYENIFIFKGINENNYIKRYVNLHCNSLLIDDSAVCKINDVKEIRFATEEEKEKLFQAIKDNGYRWNAETKTLEKLIVPKFKVGDRIRSVISLSYYTIIDIEDDQYVIKPDDPEKFPYHIHFSLETDYELVPKFDINTLKPFDKVLVRGDVGQRWTIDFFGFMDNKKGYPFVCVGHYVTQCIPYEGNEHLLGKTDECDGFYETWQ